MKPYLPFIPVRQFVAFFTCVIALGLNLSLTLSFNYLEASSQLSPDDITLSCVPLGKTAWLQ